MPNRLIKESIRTSKSVNAMTDFQFRLWVYLITYVDDFGRGSADPELLKGFVFPRRKGVSEQTIAKTLAELATIGSIRLYEVSGESYFCFPDWGKHQRVQQKRSKFPEPPENTEEKHESRYSTVTHRESPPEFNPIQSESESNPNPNSRARAEVVSAYMNRINPTPSETSLAELEHFAGEMGVDCCLRSFDIALDAKKTTWQYIRAILRNAYDAGVRCIADWDAYEDKRHAGNGKSRRAPSVEPGALEMEAVSRLMGGA